MKLTKQINHQFLFLKKDETKGFYQLFQKNRNNFTYNMLQAIQNQKGKQKVRNIVQDYIFFVSLQRDIVVQKRRNILTMKLLNNEYNLRCIQTVVGICN